VSFGSVVGAVWVLVEHYEQNPDFTSSADKWPGVVSLTYAWAIPVILSGVLFNLPGAVASSGLLYSRV